jgi:hypothetical protein
MFSLQKLILGSLLAFIANAGYAGTTHFYSLGSVIVIADSAYGANETMKPDEYTRALTSFDLSIRLGTPGPHTERQYREADAANISSWPTTETEQLRSAFEAINAYLAKERIKLNLPDTIILIKTNGKNEFGAEGWTRRNRIYLNTGAQPIGAHLVAHELFHVLSRHDPETRDAVYAIFDFKPCNNIDYKQAMHNRVITNPDCPFLMHYVTVPVKGKPTDVALMLYSKNDYSAGFRMDENMAVGLLALSGDAKNKKPVVQSGEAVVYEFEEAPELFNHISTNTDYVLHIEEICAEHFAALVTGKGLKEPKYVESLAEVLKK